MLSITPEALVVVRQVTAHPKLKPTSGLRISRHDEANRPLQIGAVSEPCAGDTVLEQQGGRLFLGPGLDARVVDSELDAVTGPDGRIQFILRAA